MTRVLVLSENFPPRTGGSSRWLHGIYSRIRVDRIVVLTAADSGSAQTAEDDGTLSVVRRSWAMPDWGLARVASLVRYALLVAAGLRLIRAEQLREIHCGRNLPEGWVGLCLSLLTARPLLCFVHGEELNTAMTSRQLAWMTRQVFRKSVRIVANSQNTMALLLSQWGIDESKLSVLYPGVDCEWLRPAEDRDGVRGRLGWANRRVVVTVGRLQIRKGHDQMLRALVRIAAAVPEILYCIVGSGEEEANLRGLVTELQLGSNVQFCDSADDEELLAIYQAADLFILPNRVVDGDFEGFGMVLVEAQATGLPVVAGASGGTRETMLVEESGCLVNADDVGAIEACVSELLRDDSRRQRMGHCGRNFVLQRFDWSAQSERINDVVNATPPTSG